MLRWRCRSRLRNPRPRRISRWGTRQPPALRVQVAREAPPRPGDDTSQYAFAVKTIPTGMSPTGDQRARSDRDRARSKRLHRHKPAGSYPRGGHDVYQGRPAHTEGPARRDVHARPAAGSESSPPDHPTTPRAPRTSGCKRSTTGSSQARADPWWSSSTPFRRRRRRQWRPAGSHPTALHRTPRAIARWLASSRGDRARTPLQATSVKPFATSPPKLIPWRWALLALVLSRRPGGDAQTAIQASRRCKDDPRNHHQRDYGFRYPD